MKINFYKYKIIFYLSNLCLFVIYFFPGSLAGCIFHDNCKSQPELAANLIISLNHFLVFFLLSFIGFLSFKESSQIKKLTIYLIFLSIFIEFSHLVIQYRSFEISDIIGNLFGVLVVIFIHNLINKHDFFKK
tara:strand:- start:1433 stop:1828 length:396 start_codon:yes stop_codon:yes gene_type:complete